MTKILLELNHLAESDRAFLDQLSMTPFVPTISGQLLPPSALYDPRSFPALLSLLPACSPMQDAWCILMSSCWHECMSSGHHRMGRCRVDRQLQMWPG